ncbi:MAG TPA: mannitol dehydrogenase family protein [Solirubrobacter sp.]|nr:mannitol dehydrogenase family protein [Solirubrobacter sp.]
MRLSRDGRAAPPVRVVHVGLGNFFRAHQAWYTARAPGEWGIAAFTGRSSGGVLDELGAQDGLYTLISRGAERDAFEVVASLSRAHAAAEYPAWLGYFEDPAVAAVTITVTEAGYLRDEGGGLDTAHPDVAADLEALRRDPVAPLRTAPVRLLAGLAARRRADAGPLAVVSCDNVAGNGPIVRRVVRDAAARATPELEGWLDASVSFVTTMVDRITPRGGPEDARAVLEGTGREDRAPVVTEPFSEWVLSGAFPAGRPPWEDAGAVFTDDVTPFEHRKLWLLNGAHSLLAYAGSIRGHATVDEAVRDDTCRAWLEQWWAEASARLDQPADALAAYRAALLERFENARMRDRLDRIAMDGSQKLPIRIVPVLLAERADGRLPGGATRVLAAWLCHLRGLGAPVNDARADDVVPLAAGPLAEAAPRVLGRLDPALADDGDVVAAVIAQSERLAAG